MSNNKRSVTSRPANEVIRIEGFSPPIISQEMFDAVQERLKVRQCWANKSDRKYLLTGFSTCPKCGAPLVGAALMKGRYRSTGAAPRYPSPPGPRVRCPVHPC